MFFITSIGDSLLLALMHFGCHFQKKSLCKDTNNPKYVDVKKFLNRAMVQKKRQCPERFCRLTDML